MKKYLFLLICFQFAAAQSPQTLVYFKNDTLSLALDLYLPQKKSDAKLPLVLFLHGGGFSGGDRKNNAAFCAYLAQNGYAAATISYTLYMKNKKFSCDGALTEKVRAFQYGVNDLWLATRYFIDNSQKFNIDDSKIFVAGSSAGGETVLHAAYWDFKTMNLYAQNSLPDNFKYAGLISGSGAIMDLNLITTKNILPMFFFHGNGDSTVPYANAAHHYCPANSSGWLMLFGSYAIYNHAVSLNSPTTLYTFCGGGHEYSAALFEKNQEPILNFLNDVLAGKKFRNHVMVATGKKNERSAAYSFCD